MRIRYFPLDINMERIAQQLVCQMAQPEATGWIPGLYLEPQNFCVTQFSCHLVKGTYSAQYNNTTGMQLLQCSFESMNPEITVALTTFFKGGQRNYCFPVNEQNNERRIIERKIPLQPKMFYQGMLPLGINCRIAKLCLI